MAPQHESNNNIDVEETSFDYNWDDDNKNPKQHANKNLNRHDKAMPSEFGKSNNN